MVNKQTYSFWGIDPKPGDKVEAIPELAAIERVLKHAARSETHSRVPERMGFVEMVHRDDKGKVTYCSVLQGDNKRPAYLLEELYLLEPVEPCSVIHL